MKFQTLLLIVGAGLLLACAAALAHLSRKGAPVTPSPVTMSQGAARTATTAPSDAARNVPQPAAPGQTLDISIEDLGNFRTHLCHMCLT